MTTCTYRSYDNNEAGMFILYLVILICNQRTNHNFPSPMTHKLLKATEFNVRHIIMVYVLPPWIEHLLDHPPNKLYKVNFSTHLYHKQLARY